MSAAQPRSEEAAPNIAADRVLQVLSAFVGARHELGAADISRQVGLDKSVVHRILTTLTRHKYVQQDEQTRKYRVGVTAWELGRNFVARSWVSDLAVPLLQDLLQKHGSTGYVGSLDGCDIVYLATVNGSGPFQVSREVGSRTSAFTSSLGRAILAEVTTEEVDRAIREAPKPFSAAAKKRLRKELEVTRTRGYALSRGESRAGVGAVGAAVVDAQGNPVGAVSVAFPMMAEYEPLWEALPPAIAQIARDVSRRLE